MVDFVSWIFCAGSFLVTFYLIRRRGFLDGARPAWLVCLLIVPCWMLLPVAVMHVDARCMACFAILLGFLLLPCQYTATMGLYFSDLFILLIVTGMTISQINVQSVAPMAPFDPIREIALPYFVGRLFLQTPRDIESILPVFCWCILILASMALFEAVLKQNVIEIVLERSWKGSEEIDSVRWGLKRAYGTQTHPIYFGLTFALLLPWAIEAAVQSYHHRGPRWWKFTPLFALIGVVSTGSRAAQVVSITVLGTTLFHAAPRLRPLFIFLIAFGGIGFYAARDEVVNLLQNYADESKEGDSFVMINGEQYEYSGTKHRDLLLVVYREAIENAGWLGYGTQMKQLPRDSDMDARFISIDNHYLMFFLQYGDLSLLFFALLAASVLWNLLGPFLRGTGPSGRIAAGLLGSIGGCLIAMRGVWFANDYSTVWLFCAGMTVPLAAWQRLGLTSGANLRA